MAARVLRVNGPRARSLIVSAVAVGHALALVLIPLRATPLPAYAGASGLTLLPDLLGGAGLLASGLLVLALGARSRVGILALLASIAWWAPIWVGWEGGSPIARSIGMVIAPFLVPLLLHIVSATTARGRRGIRALIVMTYVLAIVASIGRALVRDPFLDLDCGSNCRDNVFLVWPDRALAAILDMVLEGGALLGGAALAAYAVIRLAAATWPDRRAHGAVLVPGLFVGVTEAAYAVALLSSSLESATDPLFVDIFLARAAAVTALGIGISWVIAKARLTTADVTRLARNLATATGPGGLRSALARALGDPGLQIAYWLPQPARFVDDVGAPVDVASIPAGRMATPILRGGNRVALVIHQTEVDPDSLIRDIGAAARLVAENERLQAEVRAQVADLRESRRRIVATADESRRRLERDLHDGAQQRLLALSYELRLAQAAAKRDGKRDLAIDLDRASDETLAALDELRDLAHGIFPAILAEAGLGAALETLGDRSPFPVRVSIDLDSRCPDASETTAYIVIDEAIRSAARRGANSAAVRVARSDSRLEVRVQDDAAAPAEDLTHLVDRVGAVGGELVAESTSSGQVLRAEIPCV